MSFASIKIPSWAFGEVLTSAQMNQINADIPNAVDGAGGGTYNLTALLALQSAASSGVPIVLFPDILELGAQTAFVLASPVGGAHSNVTGDWDIASTGSLTWKGTSKWPQVDARSIHYEQPILNIVKNDSSRFSTSIVASAPVLTQQNVTDGGSLWIPLTNIPARGTITGFGMSIDGNGGGSSHANLPGITHRPKISVYQFNSAGTLINSSTVEDTPASLAAYETLHSVTGTQNYPLDGSTTLYLEVRGEDGADAVNGALRVYNVWVTATVTEVGA